MRDARELAYKIVNVWHVALSESGIAAAVKAAAAKLLEEDRREGEAECERLRAENERLAQAEQRERRNRMALDELLARLRTEVERLKQWVNDLHSGMYINCVYCGHRYGPNPGTPVAMADVLRAHIEQCPEHPLSKARAENAALVEALKIVCDGNDLAAERGESILNWKESHARKCARAALAERRAP